MRPHRFAWSSWQPLEGSGRVGAGVPDGPGLYRIRSREEPGLLYVGQSARLQQRMGHLRPVFGDVIPWNDPHTVGSALWCHLRSWGGHLEVSFVDVAGTKSHRLATECLAISLYRIETGGSPAYNFGRMPPGYRASGPRKSGHAGGPTGEVLDVHSPSIAPSIAAIDLHSPAAPDWLGLDWRQWGSLSDRAAPASPGLYRLLCGEPPWVFYVGEAGNLRERLRTHARQIPPDIGGHRVEVHCYEALGATRPQRLELENDAIAAIFRATGAAPAGQFGRLADLAS